jgi:biotin carboxylase
MAAIKATVLVGFAESLAAVESVWCLRDAGFRVVAFTRDGCRPALTAARDVRVVPVPAPERDLAATLHALRALVAAEAPVAMLPFDDAALLLTDRLTGTRPVAGPTGPAAALSLDKSEQLELAAKAGFAVPETVVLRPGAARPDELPGTGPWMVKCAAAEVERDGRLSRPSGGIARTADEARRIASSFGAPALVQHLVHGVGEGIFGFAAGGEVHALSGHRRVRMMNPRGSGSSACRSIDVEPELARSAARFCELAGWHGIFMVELLRDEAGQTWFMELNGRTWGSMALARARGLAYPEWAVRGALDPDFRPPAAPAAPHLLSRHLGREIVHLLAVLRGARDADAGRWPARRATVAAMLRPGGRTRWYNARRGELSVLTRDTWQTVAGQVRRRR